MVGAGLAAMTVAVRELLVGSGSSVADATVAVLAMLVPLGRLQSTSTTRSKVTLAWGASALVAQLMVPVPPGGGVVQDQPAGAVSDWKVVPAGKASVKVTSSAASDIPFTTPMVYGREEPV